MTLKQAEFFNELSPYSLVILAQNVEIETVNYGELIVKQGETPECCYILLEGECKAVYIHQLSKSTAISKWANKCLQHDSKARPMSYSLLDYVAIPAMVK